MSAVHAIDEARTSRVTMSGQDTLEQDAPVTSLERSVDAEGRGTTDVHDQADDPAPPGQRGPVTEPTAAGSRPRSYEVSEIGRLTIAADAAEAEIEGEADYQQRLGARLRAVRRSQGLRLQDVEQRSDGVFKAVVVGSYERGDRAIAAHKLAALADFYGIPVASLLPEEYAPDLADRAPGWRISLEVLYVTHDPELTPLKRLAQHVLEQRGEPEGTILTLRADDLQTVAVALAMRPEALVAWLRERDLLVD